MNLFGPFTQRPAPIFGNVADVYQYCRQYSARMTEMAFEHEIAAATMKVVLKEFPVSGARSKARAVAGHLSRAASAHEDAGAHIEAVYSALLKAQAEVQPK